MVENPTFLAAFVAGLLSFISPCVLPLIPGYLSFISGLTLDEMQGDGAAAIGVDAGGACSSRRSSSSSASRSCSSSLGAAASALGQFLLERQPDRSRRSPASIVIVFGLHTMGVLRIGWLVQREARAGGAEAGGPLGAFLVGLAFAFGWTPCIGPILGGILAIAGSQDTVGEGVRLLAVYSLGLGIPFLLTSLAINQFFAAFANDPQALPRRSKSASGVLLCRDRRADLHRPVHDHRPVAVAVPADVLAIPDWVGSV